MAKTARKHDLDLEENGLVRSAIFPNQIRDLRKMKGYPTLREFANQNGELDVNYTRMAKIERGEVVPAKEEIASIATSLRVPVGRLLIDTSDPDFDHEKWARDHVEGKADHRGGNFDAMLIGAALRVARHEQNLSSSFLKEQGLAVATVSRIENAERPFERWDGSIQRGIAKALGVTGPRKALDVARRMYKEGKLDKILLELFSPSAITERSNRRLRNLLKDFPDDPVAMKIMQRIEPNITEELDIAPSSEVSVTALGTRMSDDGAFVLEPSGRSIMLPSEEVEDSLAISMVELVLGPGLPVGSVLIFKRNAEVKPGDVVALFDKKANKAFVLSATHDGEKLTGFSMMTDRLFDLSALGNMEMSKMSRVILA